jgi:broad specificity phosphatase PhoE
MTPADKTGADRVTLPRTDRAGAPAYLTRYLERRATEDVAGAAMRDGDVPLYLRRFRERRGTDDALEEPLLAPDGEDLGTTRGWADVTRTKELVPERRDQAADVVTDVYFVRHGETQGYSSESGLTPLGSWQAHRRGQELARGVMTGHTVRMACADTNRARQTAEHLRRGLLDGLRLFGRDAEVGDITAYREFQNFGVSTPDGVRDVTSAFRLYAKEMERYERLSLGERPGWLVEIDRFWKIQQGGGDPITHWLTMPMIFFEPPISAVRRFWAGLLRVHADSPGESIVVATHSGPIRAFATWAMGYDPGEPFNTEFVRVRLIGGGVTALVLYRNRVQEVHVPDLASLPDWWTASITGGV